MRSIFDGVDGTVDGWFDGLRGRSTADRVYEVASQLGDFGLIWVFLAVAQGLRSDADARRIPRMIAIFIAESIIVNQGVKRLFQRSRPTDRPVSATRLREPLTSSFPSGHASSAACATVVLTEGDPKLRIVMVPVAAIVATSRIHTRMHHPSDVAVGAALGWVLGRAAKRLWPDPHVANDHAARE